MKKLIAAVLLLICGSANASIITIDFDDLPLGGTPLLGDFVEVTTQGYSFVSEAGVSDLNPDYPGDKGILGFSSGIDFDTGEISFSRIDGEAFALYAADVDLVEFYIASSDEGNFDSLSGPGLDEFGTGAWLNINSVLFFGSSPPFAPVYLDNVVVGNAVPIPAAAWLFASGLGLLGFLRRRSQA